MGMGTGIWRKLASTHSEIESVNFQIFFKIRILELKINFQI